MPDLVRDFIEGPASFFQKTFGCFHPYLLQITQRGDAGGLYAGWVMINEKIKEIGIKRFYEKSKTRPRYI